MKYPNLAKSVSVGCRSTLVYQYHWENQLAFLVLYQHIVRYHELWEVGVGDFGDLISITTSAAVYPQDISGLITRL